MSNYCACSGGDEEYTIELNQQGPEGPQGPIGPEGFSPSISIKTNTDKAYVLTVVNKEGNFDTPNLYGETEKLNADLSNIPNPAFINGIALSRSVEGIPSIEIDGSKIATDIDGNLMLSASSENEQGTESFNYEVVVNPAEQRLELHDKEGTVKIVATTDYIPTIGVATTTTAGIVKPDGSTITVSPDGTISAVQPDLSNYATKEELNTLDTTLSADIAVLDADKLEQTNILAGTNITIDRNGNDLTINSTGGGGGGGAAIDDGSISTASTWSSSKINSEITTVANTKNDNIFDIGKFTVIGSPTITDEGVASGFSASNYINIPVFNATGDFEIRTKFKLNSYTNHYNNIFRVAISSYTGSFGFLVSINSSGFIYASGMRTVDKTYSKIELNTEYDLHVKVQSGQYYIYLNNNLLDNDTFIKSIETAYLTLGGGTESSNLETGSIYLKQFSVTVDGEQVFNGLMESTKPIYDKIATTSSALSTFETDTDNNFSAVNSALNEKANLSDLAGYVTVNKYNELLARVVALETEINGGNA